MRNKLLLTLSTLLLTLNVSAKDIDSGNLVIKNGFAYPKSSKHLFTGNAYTFFKDGKTQKIVPYYQGLIDGRLREWRSNGTIKTIAYFKAAKQSGEYIVKFPNGKKSIIAYFKDGKQDGEVATWYDSGIKKSLSYYKDDVQTGEAKTWHDNGLLATSIYYVNGVKDGEFKQWHKNGVQAYGAKYVNGKIHGAITSWNQNGVQIIKK